jgi:hypothetical protein
VIARQDWHILNWSQLFDDPSLRCRSVRMHGGVIWCYLSIYLSMYGMHLLSNLGGAVKRSVNMTWQSFNLTNTWLSSPDISKSTLYSPLLHSEYTLYYTIYTMSQAPIGMLYPIKQGGKQLTSSPSIRLRQDWPTPFCQGT